jgi:hypothetical protein
MIGMITLIAVVVVLAGIVGFVIWRRRMPAMLNTEFYQERWHELQKLLRDKAQWAQAIIDADQLLDNALKKKKFRGRSMGERLVKAQRLFSDNDSVWFGHKLKAKIDSEPDLKLKEKEVKQALLGIRQALKDVGALPSGQPGNQK